MPVIVYFLYRAFPEGNVDLTDQLRLLAECLCGLYWDTSSTVMTLLYEPQSRVGKLLHFSFRSNQLVNYPTMPAVVSAGY